MLLSITCQQTYLTSIDTFNGVRHEFCKATIDYLNANIEFLETDDEEIEKDKLATYKNLLSIFLNKNKVLTKQDKKLLRLHSLYGIYNFLSKTEELISSNSVIVYSHNYEISAYYLESLELIKDFLCDSSDCQSIYYILTCCYKKSLEQGEDVYYRN